MWNALHNGDLLWETGFLWSVTRPSGSNLILIFEAGWCYVSGVFLCPAIFSAKMRIPRSLTMDEMALYVLGNFEWYLAKEYAREYDLFETPQVVFLAMLLNDAVKLGVLHGCMIDVIESTLTELGVEHLLSMGKHNRDRILEAHCEEADSDQDEQESSGLLRFHGRRTTTLKARFPHLWGEHAASRPFCRIPDTEEAAHDFNILEIIQATFYAMVVNDAVKLSVVSRNIAEDLRSILKGLQWTSFKSRLSVNKRALLEAQLHPRIPPRGDLGPMNGQEGSSVFLPPSIKIEQTITWDIRLISLLIFGRERKSECDRESSSRFYTVVFPYYLNTKQAADYVRETFIWHLRGFVRPPQPLPEDYCILCPNFNLKEAEASFRDFHIPELTRLSSMPWCSMMLWRWESCVSSVEVDVESASTSSSSEGETSSSGRVVLKNTGHAQEAPVQEVVAKGMVFPGAPHTRASKIDRALTSLSRKSWLP
ncbi:hypothetical protein Cgig2_000408 [Carnegiea gigantea]|uniref:Uncharacterized protein n=1 Tax=Carnegiea gigantea TaxID=171969 RepID=A0A9Q1GTX3_9CARY|nr:hypothetical protein Cgig2_000408 [Carnegiea gigantea]